MYSGVCPPFLSARFTSILKIRLTSLWCFSVSRIKPVFVYHFCAEMSCKLQSNCMQMHCLELYRFGGLTTGKKKEKNIKQKFNLTEKNYFNKDHTYILKFYGLFVTDFYFCRYLCWSRRKCTRSTSFLSAARCSAERPTWGQG